MDEDRGCRSGARLPRNNRQMRYLKISNGVLSILTNERGKLTLDELQAHVGGYIEAPLSRHGLILYCNEEGRLKNLSANFYSPDLQQNVVGDVLIIAERNGEQCEMTDAQMQRVRLVQPVDNIEPVLVLTPQGIMLGVEYTLPRLEIA